VVNESDDRDPSLGAEVDASQADSGSDAAPAELGHVGSGTLNRRRTIIGAIVAIVFLVVVFVRVIPQVGDYQAAFDALADMTVAAVVALVVALLIYLFIYGWPYVVASPGLSYTNSSIVNNSRFAIGNGIPGGGAFGLAVQYAQLTFYKATPTTATAAIGATGVWATFVTVSLPLAGVAALSASGQDVGNFIYVALAGLGILLAMIIVFALILRSEKNAVRIGDWADRVGNKVVGRFRPGTTVAIKQQVVQLRNDIVGLVSARWLLITITNFGVSLGQYLILLTALKGVAGDESDTIVPLEVFGAWAVSQIGILIPVTPGGLGTVDAVLIGLLTSVGISEGVATAGALLWRATYYFPQIAIGVICVFIWRWQVGRAGRAPSPQGAAVT